MESEFDTATIQPLPKLRKTLFKDPSVEKEYGGVNPELREIIDNAPNPVTVTSGFRDPAKNAAVGGVPNSLHQNGDATDIRYDDKWPENKKYFAQNGVNVLEEKDHPHLSYKGKPKTVDDEFDTATIQPLDAAPDAPDINKGLYAQPEKTKMQKLGSFINKPLVGKIDLQGILGVNPEDNEQFAHMDPNKLMERGLFKETRPEVPQMPFNPKDDKETPLSQGMAGAGKSAVDLATGLTTPKNLGMLALSAANPLLGLAAAAPSIPGMLKGSYEGLKSGKVNRESGNYEQAGSDYTNAIANGLMGLGLAKGVGGVVGSGLSTAAGASPETLTGKTVGALGKGLNALTDTPEPDLYNKAINPEVQKIAQEGYPLPASDITQSRWQQLPQKALERNPMTAQMFKDFGDAQRAQLQSEIGNFKEGVGTAPPEEVGDAVNEGINFKTQDFKKKSSDLYNKVSELAGAKQQPLNNLSDKIQQVLGDEADTLPGQEMPAVTGKLKKTLETINPDAVLKELGVADDKLDYNAQGKTFDQMMKIKSRYGKLAQGKDIVGTPEQGIYKQMAKGVGQDMDAFAEKNGGDILDSYQKANEFYGPGKQLLNSKLSRSLQELAQDNPSGIATAVVRPGQYRRVQMAKELLGDHFDLVKQQFAQKLISEATVIPKGSTEPVIQGSKLMSAIDRYGNKNPKLADKVLGEVFTPEELGQLRNLGQKSALSQSAVKASGAAVGRLGQPTTFSAVTKPFMGLAGYPLAKFMLSDFGRRLLSTKTQAPAIGKVALPFNPLTNPLNRGLYKEKQQ